MSPWIYLVGGAVLLLLVFRRLSRRTDPTDAWRGLAESEGLRFESTGAGPSVRGRYRDTEVRLSAERGRGAGPTDEPATVIQAEIGLPGTTGVWGAASHRLVDGQDPWARPGRDGLALVRQQNSDPVVRALARQEVREGVQAFLSARPSARIAEDWVTVSEPGLVRDRRRLQRLLDDVVEVSRLFRAPADGAAASDPIATSPPGADGWAGAAGAGAAGGTAGGTAAGTSDENRGRDYWDAQGRPAPADASADPRAGEAAGRGADRPSGPTADNPYAPPQPRRSQASDRPLGRKAADPQIAARWKRRLAVAFLVGLLPATLGAAMAIVGGFRYDAPVFGIEGLWWMLLGGGLFAFGILVFGTQYRCPSCGQVMRSPSTGNLLFDPDECPHCHVVLRD
jgi:hypothetical protein